MWQQKKAKIWRNRTKYEQTRQNVTNVIPIIIREFIEEEEIRKL